MTQPFLLYALLAATPIAALSGLLGSFLVLRAQVFTSDALSHAALAGAAAALAFGIDLRLGLVAAAVLAAGLMAVLGRQDRPTDDVVIGAVFSWMLGLGALFLNRYAIGRSGGSGGAGTTILFGSIFGLSPAAALTTAAVSLGLIMVVLAIGRPLLFASLDPAVAAARGVPVRRLGLGFLVLVALGVAQATQAVGALLVLGLLAAPAGAARLVTARVWAGLGLAVGFAVAATWLGLGLTIAIPWLTPSFTVIATAALGYAMAAIWRAGRARRDRGAAVERLRTVPRGR